ncbi:MAG: carbonate dehydratase [Desulfobulbaceae bacterium DB1]|nr:MAG: carbonate dehydratase [Desulfobulbaceae bacterium DB1]
MNSIIDKQWHHLPTKEILDRLSSNAEKGLEQSEVEQLREKFGPNALTAKKGKGPLKRFLLQFHQPLIYILIVSGIITALLREWVDSGVIFGVVLVNAIIGYIQEAKAVNALAALARTMTTVATVVRQGEKKQIPATELVPGDIVLLASGDKVPADMRLLSIRDLRIDESALTGESLPVEKKAGELKHDTLLADRLNMAYASSLVTFGQGKGIVTAIGNHTEVGRISELIAAADELATPLTRKIAHFSHILLYAILGLAGITVAVGLLRGQSLFDMFMAAVALAVGAIPEGLPAAVTITLAIGVSRMAKQKAIIRKLPAVETLGSTTVICSDKTGTLTENQMTVQKIIAGGVEYEVSGAGYNPFNGEILQNGNNFDPGNAPVLVECLRAGILCNDSLLLQKDKEWLVQGDPTEGALFVPAIKGGMNLDEEKKRFPRLDVLPFESEHQYMATLHESKDDDKQLIFIKGAVEAVLGRCGSQLDAGGSVSDLDAEKIIQQVERMAKMGLRVLAFAEKKRPVAADGITHDDIRSDLVFIGLAAMIDPPRAEAIRAVKVCQNAGISVKMITGDHAVTAGAIAMQIGLNGTTTEKGDGPLVLTGSDLAALSDRQLIEQVEKTSVFARVAPEQKLRLVKALQSRGHVVAMTGDGVNDAPALKQADIGVAMGITGTEVSKEAADMVLTDDNFSSIEAAVEEGRGVFDNLTKFIVWTLPTNLGEGLVIMAAIFLGVTLPILPVQILWINMTTAGFLGLMLAFEPKEPGIMTRMPRNPKTPILTGNLIGRILLVGGLLLVFSFALFQWELADGADIAQARTVAVNAFVVMELFYLFNCRSLTKSIFQLGFFSNMWVFVGVATMLLVQIIYTYLPVMNRLFQGAPISLESWGRIVAAGIITYLIIEAEKWLWSRKGDQ